jgi:type IV secretory pathway VirB2 component (pilin)
VTKKHLIFLIVALVGVTLFFPEISHASLESSLLGLKSKLTGVILPVVAVIGICFAGISFFTGNPNAKQHIFYAVIGASVGFGAQAIVDFLSQVVR